MKEYEQQATKIMINALEGVKAQIRKAYDKGYRDGKADTPFTDTEEAEKKAYNRGLNDAWEVIKKITRDDSVGGYSLEMMQNLFSHTCVYDIVHNYTASEAIAKIKGYEDKQEQDAEIKVGDEVKSDSGSRGVVITNKTDANGDISVLFKTHSHVQLYPKDGLTRTGRTFPQIAEVLAKLRGTENDEQ